MQRADGGRSGYIDGSMDGSVSPEREGESPRRRLPRALRKQHSRCAPCGWRRQWAKFTWLIPNQAFHRLGGYKVLQGISYAARIPEMGAQ